MSDTTNRIQRIINRIDGGGGVIDFASVKYVLIDAKKDIEKLDQEAKDGFDQLAISERKNSEMELQIEQLQAKLDAVQPLVDAVKALPVEEWVEQERDGSPYLVGYVMQAQGEWDRVESALRDLEPESQAPKNCS